MIDMDILSIFVDAAVAIVVAILGFAQTKKAKEDEAYRKLREELEKEREEKLTTEKREQENRLETMESNMKSLTEDVEKIKMTVETLSVEKLNDINTQLQNLHKMEFENFSYIHSLSNMVTGMSEALSNSSLLDPVAKEKFESGIEEHKKAETDIHSKLYKMIL